MAFTDRIIIQFGNSRKDLSLTSCVTHQWAKYVRSCCWYCKVNIDKWIYHPKQYAERWGLKENTGKAISYQVTLSDLFNITSIPRLSLMLATSRYPRFTHCNKNIMNYLLSLIFSNKPFFVRVFMKYPKNIIKSGSYIIFNSICLKLNTTVIEKTGNWWQRMNKLLTSTCIETIWRNATNAGTFRRDVKRLDV